MKLSDKEAGPADFTVGYTYRTLHVSSAGITSAIRSTVQCLGVGDAKLCHIGCHFILIAMSFTLLV